MSVSQERVPKAVAERRRQNLLHLYQSSGANTFAEWLRSNGGLDYNYMNQIRNGHKLIADKWRLKIEEALKLPAGTLDEPDISLIMKGGPLQRIELKYPQGAPGPSVVTLAEKVAEYGSAGRLTEAQARPLLELLESIVKDK